MSRTAPCQVMQESQAGVVAPVQVFHHEQHGVRPGLAGQEVGQRLKAAALLLFGIEEWQHGRRSSTWKQVADIREQREEAGPTADWSRKSAQGPAERVGDGVIGRKATTLRKQKVVSESLGFDLGHQA